ncbi:uncharacterized protein encoded by LINC01551-like [Lontra canadensis]|uniref:uncharacterized protein encoded by LINC01551-like n=1 Tax=Lontra canadensis TaxID=76717 RepID=UPI0013F381D5|nr:uncharacterized protein encoded by LINC01551-like [Lontra canadensis]
MELSNVKICAAIPTSGTAWCWPKDAEEKDLRTGTLLPQDRGFSLASTMKVDGMIIHFTSKDIYSSVCCCQSEVSKYVFSNSRKSSWIQAETCLGTP